jgi:phospholipid transport system substrate-binding protein
MIRRREALGLILAKAGLATAGLATAGLATAGLAATAATTGRAWAADASPVAAVEALNAGLLQIMRAGRATPFAARAAMLTPVIQQSFDLGQILRTSVGSRFASLPAGQQTELLDLFTRYTVASYVANFDGFSGERFEVSPKPRQVGADQVVETRIVTSGGDSPRIDYVTRHTDSGWRVVDVLLDGSISRVAVQRSDFRALVGGNDAAPLIASLRQKIASLEAGGKA